MINGEVVAKLIIREKKEKDVITWKQSSQRPIQNPIEH